MVVRSSCFFIVNMKNLLFRRILSTAVLFILFSFHVTFICILTCFYFQDGEITEVMPVDYQIIHYGCPTNDIFYFIFGATDQQFRKDHFEHIKNMYHETLKKFLTYFDMDVEDYFPKKIFEKLCRERIEYGLMTAISFLPIILASEDQIPDFSKDCPATVEFKADKRIKHRLEGVVDDFVQWGFL